MGRSAKFARIGQSKAVRDAIKIQKNTVSMEKVSSTLREPALKVDRSKVEKKRPGKKYVTSGMTDYVTLMNRKRK